MLDFYGFREQPFGTTPDPRFLYALPSMSEAIASLSCGMEYKVGFAALVADPGMGKTTILLDLLNRYNGKTQTAFIFNTQCSGAGLLRQIADDLGAPSSGGLTETHETLKAFFVSHGAETPVLVVIDEAQNLGEEALEAVRLLSDCETTDRKLLHIVLAGQPQLTAKLQDPSLLQLQQRITMVTRLERLTKEQTAGYISHRLSVAGGSGTIFADKAVSRIAAQSDGIPREINRLCFNALLLGCANKQGVIREETIEEVIEDLRLPRAGHALSVPQSNSRVVPIDRAHVIDDGENSPVAEEVPTLAARTGTDEMTQYSASTLPWLLRLELAQLKRGEPHGVVGPLYVPTEPLAVQKAPAVEAREVARENVTAAPLIERIPETPPRSLPARVLQATESAQFQWMFPVFAVAIVLAAVLGVLWESGRHQVTTTPRRETPRITNEVQTGAKQEIAQPTPKKTRQISRSDKAAEVIARTESTTGTERAKSRPEISPPSAARSPEAQAAISGAVRREAQLLQRMNPQYPPAALARHVEGAVKLKLAVGIDGRVKMVQVESGNPLFLRDAVKAAREWIYEPATINGQRIPTEVPVTVRFTLPAQ